MAFVVSPDISAARIQEWKWKESGTKELGVECSKNSKTTPEMKRKKHYCNIDCGWEIGLFWCFPQPLMEELQRNIIIGKKAKLERNRTFCFSNLCSSALCRPPTEGVTELYICLSIIIDHIKRSKIMCVHACMRIYE